MLNVKTYINAGENHNYVYKRKINKMEEIKQLKLKLIWQLQLQVIEVGKESIKAKRPRVISGEAYIKGIQKKKIHKAKSLVNQKSVQLQSLLKSPDSKLRDGNTPASQKQINQIEVLLSKSKKKYDYYFPRDKYRLSQDKAGAFIQAIGKQQDFSFNTHTKAYKKFVQAKINDSKLNEQLDYDMFFDND